MKRNLFTGIFLISAIALSSCSTMDKLSKSEDMGDDVYYTKAKAGDQYDYVAQYNQQQLTKIRNDDYYYYGDYESRINRFGYYSPFAYQDDYYSYVPYSYYTPAVASPYDYGYNPYYDFGTYVAFDFGFGYYGGYDNYGYGTAYSSYLYNGGGRRHGRGYSVWGNGWGGTGSAFTPANAAYPLSRYVANNPGANYGTGAGPRFVGSNGSQGAGGLYSGSRPGGSNAVYPGRPGTNAATSVGTPANNTANRPYVRPTSENPRPVVQQPNIERPAPVMAPASSSNNSGSSSTGSSSSSGGGGRPVRP